MESDSSDMSEEKSNNYSDFNFTFCEVLHSNKEREKIKKGGTSENRDIKMYQSTKGETSHPNRATDALISEQKKETESEPPVQLPWIIWSVPTTRRDHTVGLFL